MNEELYDLLEVAKDASPAAIKTAYRRLAAVHHPDRGGDADHFIELTMAYNTLMDPELREKYDLTGDHGGENPLVVQQRLIANLALLFEQVLAAVPSHAAITEVDIVAVMRENVGLVKKQNQTLRGELTRALKAFHKVRNRIKRKGEEKNIFAEITERRITELSEELKHTAKVLADIDRMEEELMRYDSIVDVVRFVQTGIYRGSAGSSSGGSFFGQIIFGG